MEEETQNEQGICINWAQKVTLDRPIIECTLLSPNSGQQKTVSGLLDTGADISIISAKDWPSTWGTTRPAVDIQGVGGSKIPLQSILPLLVQGPQDFLAPLFQLLKGEAELTSPRQLTPEAESIIEVINQKISEQQVNRRVEGLPTALLIFRGPKQPFAVIGQLDSKNKKFLLWEWVFLSHQFSKTIVTLPEMLAKVCHKGKLRMLELSGKDPDFLYVPLSKSQLRYYDLHLFDFQQVMSRSEMDTVQASKDPPRSFPPSSTSSRSSTNGFSTNYRKRSSISITFGIILFFTCSITPANQKDLTSGALATPPPTIPNWVKQQFEEQVNRKYSIFRAILYRTQKVSGTMYFIKVQVSGTDYVHLKVFVGPPAENVYPALISFQTGKTRNDPLDYF
ncbi:uncharacterized protein LOC116782525 [Chiroxiphia lanceolata]|uniref:uncharacterized protein LOC116782525 n=1 Tax=Chiroxiphia lanceolata TaxID=296741 RepID=UPI0013CE6154|nr:uncharacterized protein LOC116782525 [Chiroxiphia lanceolata]